MEVLFHDLCLNHCLALRADAGTYYINGNWRIQLPGDVKADGTVFRYLRKGTLEKIIARGPINEPLHIMVSFAFTLSPYEISFYLPCPLLISSTRSVLRTMHYIVSPSIF